MALPYAVRAVLDCYPNLSVDAVVRRLRHSTFVSVPKRYMYFEVPKAASTAMRELLNTIENAPPIKCFIGKDRAARRDMYLHTPENVALPALLDLDDHMQRTVLNSPDFLRMTLVRNPYTRLIAAWQNKVLLCEPGYERIYWDIKGHWPELGKKSLVSFEEFVAYVARWCDLRVADLHWRRQVDHTLFRAINYSVVGKVENMADFIGKFQRHLGLDQPLMAGQKNVSPPGNSIGIRDELAAQIYQLYEADFETFRYERNSYPTEEREGKRTVPEEKYIDEIIERNLILTHLYDEQAKLRRLERLHLLELADAVFSVSSLLRRGWSRLGRGLAKLVGLGVSLHQHGLSSGNGADNRARRKYTYDRQGKSHGQHAEERPLRAGGVE